MTDEYKQLLDILAINLMNNNGQLTKEQCIENLSQKELKKLDTFEYLVLSNVYNYKEFAFYAIYADSLNPNSIEYFKLKHIYLNQSWYAQIFKGICIEFNGDDMLYYDYFSYLIEAYVDYLTKKKNTFKIQKYYKRNALSKIPDEVWLDLLNGIYNLGQGNINDYHLAIEKLKQYNV